VTSFIGNTAVKDASSLGKAAHTQIIAGTVTSTVALGSGGYSNSVIIAPQGRTRVRWLKR